MATDRAREVLFALCSHHGPVGLSTSAVTAGVGLATAARALDALRAARLVMRVSTGHAEPVRYLPTAEACRLAEAAARGDELANRILLEI